MQGANCSLNEGLSCKRFKHLRAKMQMDISHLKTAPFQGTLFIFFKQETDTAWSSFPHYSCKRSLTSLFGGDRMAFSDSIKARERPCTQKRKKKGSQNRGKTKTKPGETKRENKRERPRENTVNRRRWTEPEEWGRGGEERITQGKSGPKQQRKRKQTPEIFSSRKTEHKKTSTQTREEETDGRKAEVEGGIPAS